MTDHQLYAFFVLLAGMNIAAWGPALLRAKTTEQQQQAVEHERTLTRLR